MKTKTKKQVIPVLFDPDIDPPAGCEEIPIEVAFELAAEYSYFLDDLRNYGYAESHGDDTEPGCHVEPWKL